MGPFDSPAPMGSYWLPFDKYDASSPFLSNFAGSRSVFARPSVRPSVRSGWDDKCRSRSYRFVEWQKLYELNVVFKGLPLRTTPYTVSCNMVFGCISCRHTWPNYDSLRRLTDDNKPGIVISFSECQTSAFNSCHLNDFRMQLCSQSAAPKLTKRLYLQQSLYVTSEEVIL